LGSKLYFLRWSNFDQKTAGMQGKGMVEEDGGEYRKCQNGGGGPLVSGKWKRVGGIGGLWKRDHERGTEDRREEVGGCE
jgi:hypothetical protein